MNLRPTTSVDSSDPVESCSVYVRSKKQLISEECFIGEVVQFD